MARWAYIQNDLSAIIKERSYEPAPNPIYTVLRPDSGKPFWVPVVREIDDQSTGPDRVVGPWTDTIELVQTTVGNVTSAGRVHRVQTIRDMTPAEKQAADDTEIDRQWAGIGMWRAALRTFFDLENRVRALEGSPAVDVPTFKAGWRSRMRP